MNFDEDGELEPASAFNIGWRDPDSLRVLCEVAGEIGLLDGVEVVPLAVDPTRSELEPPEGVIGIGAAHHVLGCLAEIARRTRAGLGKYTWLRSDLWWP